MSVKWLISWGRMPEVFNGQEVCTWRVGNGKRLVRTLIKSF